MKKLDRLRDAVARRIQSPHARLREPDARRELLLQRHQIDLVFDVGANEGQYAHALRERCAYTGRIVSFEPVPEAFAVLAPRTRLDALWDCERVALSDREGEAEINVGPATVLSSLLVSRKAFDGTPLAARGWRSESVVLTTLDRAAPSHMGGQERILVKIDVQGSEPQVLLGGEATLSRVALVECELPMIALYDGQRSFRQLIDQLDDLGFSPISVQPNMIDSSSGYVVDVDIVFVRGVVDPLGR